jgi:hypothetical protein
MPNYTRTVIDNGDPILRNEESRDELITFAGAATFKAGTILARDSVSLKLVKFVKGGSTNQNGIPKAVLCYPVTAAGAGDVAARALIKGEVIKDRLVIDPEGDDTNNDAAVIDLLRDYGITPISVKQLAQLDN